jgi:hypothetical protein
MVSGEGGVYFWQSYSIFGGVVYFGCGVVYFGRGARVGGRSMVLRAVDGWG